MIQYIICNICWFSDKLLNVLNEELCVPLKYTLLLSILSEYIIDKLKMIRLNGDKFNVESVCLKLIWPIILENLAI